jgi:hypothetical protein
MAESPLEDQELLRQLRKGNETAFTALYERYQGPIYRFALHMSGNTATAEEVTQEVAIMVMGSSWVMVKVRTFSFGADSCATAVPATRNALASKIAIRFIDNSP